MNKSAQVIEFDVSKRPAFHALMAGHNTCDHTPAQIMRMTSSKIKEFSNEQLAAILITLEQEHKQRQAACEH